MFAANNRLEEISTAAHRYFVLNKPYGMVSQFVSPDTVPLLGEIDFDFPGATHAVGRLDHHSEGLLLLTTNKKVTRLLFQGEVSHTRTYHVQVQGEISANTLSRLSGGVDIRIRTGIMYRTAPCDALLLTEPGYGFDPPGLSKPYPPFSWISLTLTEGKYHQVRKMVAAVGHKCQRLVRTKIEDLQLGDLPPGAVREVAEADFFNSLKISDWGE